MIPYENSEEQAHSSIYFFGRIIFLFAHIATLFLMFYGMMVLQEKETNLIENIVFCLGYLAIPLNFIFLFLHAFDVLHSFNETNNKRELK